MEFTRRSLCLVKSLRFKTVLLPNKLQRPSIVWSKFDPQKVSDPTVLLSLILELRIRVPVTNLIVLMTISVATALNLVQILPDVTSVLECNIRIKIINLLLGLKNSLLTRYTIYNLATEESRRSMEEASTNTIQNKTYIFTQNN